MAHTGVGRSEKQRILPLRDRWPVLGVYRGTDLAAFARESESVACFGEFAGGEDSKRSPDTGDLLVKIKLVPGRATDGTCSCGEARREVPSTCTARAILASRVRVDALYAQSHPTSATRLRRATR
jgi:hypothetical protein